ncbi:MAG TPA: FAD:protein FMN transferase [Thermoanaerobaculia bacterium]|nr:FAD:protein FMN transferase [Thermoanaerobaculia bacterium]
MAPAIHSAAPPPGRGPALDRVEDYFAGRFEAMASPCTVLIDGDDRDAAAALLDIAAREALRIERKFSRYRTDNLVHEINHAGGRPVAVDEETAQLIDYAATCWELSAGLFDITSGVLRRVWKFDGGSRVPGRQAIEECLAHVGWGRVTWQDRTLSMPAGMEIDFGGIGKEYAVDRVAGLLAARTARSFLVNFGGDLFAGGLRRGNRTWGVGIDDPDRTGQAALYRLDVARAGLATSGDARRYVQWRGQRLGHILNPKTGWPVAGAPRSVTVVAPTCLEAGTISTLAYLQGPGARAFLEQQNVRFWIL